MEKFKRVMKISILVLIIILGFKFLIERSFGEKLKVKKWDNIYNESNIVYYFSNEKDTKVKVLNDMYKIKSNIKGEKGLLNKALKVVDILQDTVEFDDVDNSKGINGYDILKEKNGAKKVSARDMAIIYRDFLSSVGFTARIGEFRNINTKSSKQNSYYVVEYWSEEDNKWIMIDFIDRGYFDVEGFTCSSMEVLDGEIRNFNYTGKSDRKDYIPKLKKSLYTYTIMIDNTFDMQKSNSYITYIKNVQDISLKFKGGYIQPTIFTENKDLINKNPIDNIIGKDEKAYLILLKKSEDSNRNNEEEAESFVVGGFKDGKIMDKYYVRESSEEKFREVSKYSDILIKKGRNTIELSLDGENVISMIEVQKK
ncbi:lipoprotein [Clostridium carnis]